MSAVSVHHVVEGPALAPALVLVNSLGASLAMWEPQIDVLAEKLHVVRFDLRGHGRSPVPPGPYALADLGGDVVALLDELRLPRAHVAGLSLGGMVAMWLGIHAPERVDRLVLSSTSAALGPPEAWRERAALVRAHGTGAVADAVVSRWFTPGFAQARPRVVRRIREMVAATPAEGYASACAAVETMAIEADLPRIAAPTLVIAGADDPSTPPDHAARIAAAIPDARMAVIADAAHLANMQQPERFTRLLLDHLRVA